MALIGAEFTNGMFVSLIDSGMDRDAAFSVVPVCLRASGCSLRLCDRLARMIKPFLLRVSEEGPLYAPPGLEAADEARWRSFCAGIREMSGDDSAFARCSFTMAASCQGVRSFLRIPRGKGEMGMFAGSLLRLASGECPDIFGDIIPDAPGGVSGNAISVSASGSGEHVIHNIRIVTVFPFHMLSESVPSSPGLVVTSRLSGAFSRIELRQDASGRAYMSVSSMKPIHLEAGTDRDHRLRMAGSGEYEEVKQLMADLICAPRMDLDAGSLPFSVTLIFENGADCEDLCFLFANS